MKKSITIFLCLAFLSGLCQDTKPVGAFLKPIQSPSFSYYTLDSTIWMYKGVYGWSQVFRKFNVKTNGNTINTIYANDTLNLSEYITSPISATNNAIARFDGTTGKLVKNSTVIVSDAGVISTSGSVSAPYLYGNVVLGNYVTLYSTALTTSYVAFSKSGTVAMTSDLIPYLTIAASVNTYEPKITSGTTSQYWRGDKTWQTFPSFSMVYPAAGIAVSTGSAWGTSITNNSANWNTAYSWGNHASAGYVTGTPWTAMGYLTGITSSQVTNALGYTPAATSSLSGYLPLTGGTLSGSLSGTTATFTGLVTGSNFQLSDRRIKKNVHSISDLSKYDAVEFVQYTLKSDYSGKKHYGVIAQDIEKIAPELINTDDNGLKSVNYIELYAAKIAELEKRIQFLEHEK